MLNVRHNISLNPLAWREQELSHHPDKNLVLQKKAQLSQDESLIGITYSPRLPPEHIVGIQLQKSPGQELCRCSPHSSGGEKQEILGEESFVILQVPVLG